MSNKKFIVIGAVIAIVSFALGFIIAPQLNKAGLTVGENSFQAGWDAAKQRLAESGFAPAIAGMEIKTISGEVKEIKGNKISLKIRPLEPLADPKLDNRVVAVDDNTKIYKLESRDPEEYQREMEKYNREAQERAKNSVNETQPLIFPEFFVKKEIKLSDLKTGQQITVAADKDIKDVQEFKAVEITAQSTVALSPAATPVVPAAPIPALSGD